MLVLVRIEVRKCPLSIRPSMVVLAVKRQCSGGEWQFARWVIEGDDDDPTMLPGYSRQTMRIKEVEVSYQTW